jgi:hypothetical protein
MCSRETLWFLKTSNSLQTTLAAEAHLAEGQFDDDDDDNNNNNNNLILV